MLGEALGVFLGAYAAGAIIGLFMLWAIIKSAVKNAMKEVFDSQQIFVCNNPGSNDYLADKIAESIVKLQKKE